MAVPSLGRLESVEVREVWKTEAGDFTPWLAKEENLKLLGDAVGLDLELEAEEKDVGPFRADILCKDTATNDWVLIENQLERTDHNHLGQLLTYASGLKAVTIVWIAYRFTEEHRAALDWLNEISDERVNFFGLEVQVWRIGDSLKAPKFNIISKPNDWMKDVRGATRGGEVKGLSETRKLQLEYWTTFRDLLLERKSLVKPRRPRPKHWMTCAIGRAGFHISLFINTRAKRIGMVLIIKGVNAHAYCELLREQRAAIEAEIGEELLWPDKPEMATRRIKLRRTNADPSDRSQWPEQQLWLAEKLEAFHRAFSPRVKKLDASQYVHDEDGGQGDALGATPKPSSERNSGDTEPERNLQSGGFSACQADTTPGPLELSSPLVESVLHQDCSWTVGRSYVL